MPDIFSYNDVIIITIINTSVFVGSFDSKHNGNISLATRYIHNAAFNWYIHHGLDRRCLFSKPKKALLWHFFGPALCHVCLDYPVISKITRAHGVYYYMYALTNKCLLKHCAF